MDGRSSSDSSYSEAHHKPVPQAVLTPFLRLTLLGPPNFMTSFMMNCSQFPPSEVLGVMSRPLDSRVLYPTLHYTITWILTSHHKFRMYKTKPVDLPKKKSTAPAHFAISVNSVSLLPIARADILELTFDSYFLHTTLNPSGNSDSSTFKIYL